MDPSTEWTRLQDEVVDAAAAFADQLRSVDPTLVVENLGWSVGELGAHLVSMPPLYRRLNEADGPFVAPDDWDAFSRAARADIPITDGDELARSLLTGTDEFLAHLGPDPTTPWTIYGRSTTAANMAAGYLGELLLHGRDLAALTGAEVPIEAAQANAILRQHMALAPAFVDRAKAGRCPGTYRVGFRGGDEYTFVVEDGALEVTPGRPDRADGVIVADPVTFLLVAQGRASSVLAGLTGRIVAYGRNPVKLWRLGRIRAAGV